MQSEIAFASQFGDIDEGPVKITIEHADGSIEPLGLTVDAISTEEEWDILSRRDVVARLVVASGLGLGSQAVQPVDFRPRQIFGVASHMALPQLRRSSGTLSGPRSRILL